MTDDSSHSTDNHHDPFTVDTSVAFPARVQNYLVGGEDHFSVDRQAVEELGEVLPAGVSTARTAAQVLGSFIERTVRFLAAEVGLRQFLNIGAAIPTERTLHQVAQEVAPDTGFVYVGNDPVVLAHAHELRAGSPEGSTAYIHGTLRDPKAIVIQAADTLDFDMPLGVILPATLNLVDDESDPHGLLARLLKAVPSGSHLVVAHASYDETRKAKTAAAERFSKVLKDTWVLRDVAGIARFFDGLDLVSPGLVRIDEWRPRQADDAVEHPPPIYGGVARKP